VAYGARLESVLGESPRGFESPILRHSFKLTCSQCQSERKHQSLNRVIPERHGNRSEIARESAPWVARLLCQEANSTSLGGTSTGHAVANLYVLLLPAEGVWLATAVPHELVPQGLHP
jgi:hypothetical protein